MRGIKEISNFTFSKRNFITRASESYIYEKIKNDICGTSLLIALTGPAGSGKTTLARSIAYTQEKGKNFFKARFFIRFPQNLQDEINNINIYLKCIKDFNDFNVSQNLQKLPIIIKNSKNDYKFISLMDEKIKEVFLTNVNKILLKKIFSQINEDDFTLLNDDKQILIENILKEVYELLYSQNIPKIIYQNLVNLLNIPIDAKNLPFEIGLKLSEFSSWVLIFDDIPRWFKPILIRIQPPAGNGAVLITTQDEEFFLPTEHSSYSLSQGLDNIDAISSYMLTKTNSELNDSNKQEAEKTSNWFGHMPLGIETACDVVATERQKNNSYSFKNYLDDIQQNKENILIIEDEIRNQHEFSPLRLDIAIRDQLNRQIKNKSNNAYELISICAMLLYADIPTALYEYLFKYFSQKNESEKFEFILRNTSLLRRQQPGSGNAIIHSVCARNLQSDISETKKKEYSLILMHAFIYIIKTWRLPENLLTNIGLQQSFYHFLKNHWKSISSDVSDDEYVSLLACAKHVIFSCGRADHFFDAVNLINLLEQVFIRKNDTLSDFFIKISKTYLSIFLPNKYNRKETIEQLENSYTLFEKTEAAKEPLYLVESNYYLACVYRCLSDFDKTMKYSDISLKKFKEIDDKHPEKKIIEAQLLTIKTAAYRGLNNFEQFKFYSSNTRKIYNGLSENHPDAIIMYCISGEFYLEKDEIIEAKYFFKQGIIISDAHLGLSPSWTFRIRCHLGLSKINKKLYENHNEDEYIKESLKEVNFAIDYQKKLYKKTGDSEEFVPEESDVHVELKKSFGLKKEINQLLDLKSPTYQQSKGISMETTLLNAQSTNISAPLPSAAQQLSQVDILNTALQQIEVHLWGDNWQEKPLIKAIKENNIQEWQRLIILMKDLSTTDNQGNKALHAAVIAGNDDALYLLATKYQIDNSKNRLGFSALHIAILQGDATRVAFLLTHGASATETYTLQHPLFPNQLLLVSGLLLAILRGHENVVRTLYHTLRTQNLLDNHQLTMCEPLGTILHASVISRLANILHILLTDAEMKDWAKTFLEAHNSKEIKQTPLAYAAQLGLTDAMGWLITAGANPRAQNNLHDRTPLHYAVLSGNPLVVDRYLHLLGPSLWSALALTSQEPRKHGKGGTSSKTARELAESLIEESASTEENDYLTILTSLQNAQKEVTQQQGYVYPLHLTYRNLVIKGGGAKGLAYVGALEVLESQGKLVDIERVAGTSAGAITALLLALDFSAAEMEVALKHLTVTTLLGETGQAVLEKVKQAQPGLEKFLREFSQIIKQDSYVEKEKASWEAYQPRDSAKQVMALLRQPWNETALSDGSALEHWLKNLVKGKLDAILPADYTYQGDKRENFLNNLTFGRLKALIQTIKHYSYQKDGKSITKDVHFRALFVFATDIQQEKVHVFNTEEDRWARVNVIETVCASAALPGVFKPRVIENIPRETDNSQLESLTLVNGELSHNYPIEYFDKLRFQIRYLDTRIEYRQKTNQETLGLRLLQNKHASAQEGVSEAMTELATAISTAIVGNTGDVVGIMKLVWKISNILYKAEEIMQSMRGDISEHSIEIDVTGFGTTEFELVEEANSEGLGEIIEKGRQAAKQKLKENYSSSSTSTDIKNKQEAAPAATRLGEFPSPVKRSPPELALPSARESDKVTNPPVFDNKIKKNFKLNFYNNLKPWQKNIFLIILIFSFILIVLFFSGFILAPPFNSGTSKASQPRKNIPKIKTLGICETSPFSLKCYDHLDDALLPKILEELQPIKADSTFDEIISASVTEFSSQLINNQRKIKTSLSTEEVFLTKQTPILSTPTPLPASENLMELSCQENVFNFFYSSGNKDIVLQKVLSNEERSNKKFYTVPGDKNHDLIVLEIQGRRNTPIIYSIYKSNHRQSKIKKYTFLFEVTLPAPITEEYGLKCFSYMNDLLYAVFYKTILASNQKQETFTIINSEFNYNSLFFKNNLEQSDGLCIHGTANDSYFFKSNINSNKLTIIDRNIQHKSTITYALGELTVHQPYSQRSPTIYKYANMVKINILKSEKNKNNVTFYGIVDKVHSTRKLQVPILAIYRNNKVKSLTIDSTTQEATKFDNKILTMEAINFSENQLLIAWIEENICYPVCRHTASQGFEETKHFKLKYHIIDNLLSNGEDPGLINKLFKSNQSYGIIDGSNSKLLYKIPKSPGNMITYTIKDFSISQGKKNTICFLWSVIENDPHLKTQNELIYYHCLVTNNFLNPSINSNLQPSQLIPEKESVIVTKINNQGNVIEYLTQKIVYNDNGDETLEIREQRFLSDNCKLVPSPNDKSGLRSS